jgi:hypothetical protein
MRVLRRIYAKPTCQTTLFSCGFLLFTSCMAILGILCAILLAAWGNGLMMFSSYIALTVMPWIGIRDSSRHNTTRHLYEGLTEPHSVAILLQYQHYQSKEYQDTAWWLGAWSLIPVLFLFFFAVWYQYQPFKDSIMLGCLTMLLAPPAIILSLGLVAELFIGIVYGVNLCLLYTVKLSFWTDPPPINLTIKHPGDLIAIVVVSIGIAGGTAFIPTIIFLLCGCYWRSFYHDFDETLQDIELGVTKKE